MKSLKRVVVVVLAFALGMGLGSGIRFSGTAQASYRKGFSDGVDACHVEAVREGHGEWIFTTPGDVGSPSTFKWRNNRPEWKPNMGSGFID